jgi:hypothetical protein
MHSLPYISYPQHACESLTWIVSMVENEQITCRLCFQARRESILVIYIMYLKSSIHVDSDES